MTQVAVIGAGYVGLVLASWLADCGHRTTCVEISQDRLKMLQAGKSPIHEQGLEPLLQRSLANGNLSFTADIREAVASHQVIFIAVPTPQNADGTADLSAFDSVAEVIHTCARRGTAVAIKSTVPVGTGDLLAQRLGEEDGTGVAVVSNPEFLREGTAVKDSMNPTRVVIGASVREAGEKIASLYDGLGAPVIHCSRRTAELSKYASNAFLATKISFINEIAGICCATGADIGAVAEIMGADPRIGRHYLKAGLGWGGSCLPKDVSALIHTAASLHVQSPIIRAAAAINKGQREYAVKSLETELAGLKGKTVAVLGLAFKPGTDDVRESAGLDLAVRLVAAGAEVRAHDPVALGPAGRSLTSPAYCEDPYEAASACDAVILATEWPQYDLLDWGRVGSLMKRRVIFDGRNALDQQRLSSLGFTYLSFGRRPYRRLSGDHQVAGTAAST